MSSDHIWCDGILLKIKTVEHVICLAIAGREWLQVEPLFYQLKRRGEIKGRVTTKTGACIGGDYQSRDTGSVAVLIHRGRRNMVIEAAIIVPCNDNNRAAPSIALHNRVD